MDVFESQNIVEMGISCHPIDFAELVFVAYICVCVCAAKVGVTN